jgi:hypothetical protein
MLLGLVKIYPGNLVVDEVQKDALQASGNLNWRFAAA